MATKRKRLNLKEKIDVLEVAEREKLSIRSLAERFHVGKTQISELLKDKEEIRKMWVMNSNENLKNLKFRKTETSEVDNVLMKWFRSARAKNIPISGVLLQEKAREVGKSLGLESFKASNGWLEKFQIRHNISFKQICGEEKSVDPNEVTDWIEKLKSLCNGYDERDIFNADETGIFYRVLPDKTLCFKGENCRGGKNSKERLTLLLCCNILGEFETPVVIGKAQKPRCFKNIDVKKLNVSWKFNKKAWMTTEIMTDWLLELDKKMNKQRRKIILFLDNATSHPYNLKLKNIKLVFLPPNTTSKLQPLDQGIIRSLKVNYRKLFLRHVLAQMSTCKSSEELAKSVTVLDAISWISSALKKVEPTCIKNCFKKAGFLIASEAITEGEAATENSEIELADLAAHFNNANVKDYVEIDEGLPTEEQNIDVSNYINQDTTEVQTISDDDEEESPLEECKIKDYSEALKYSEQLKQFFLNNEDSEGVARLNPVNMHLEKQICYVKKESQTLLTDFFK